LLVLLLSQQASPVGPSAFTIVYLMTWGQISDELSSVTAWLPWPEAPWLPRLIVLTASARPAGKYGGFEPLRVSAFREAEAPHAAQVESAIEQWLTTRSLPEFDNAATAYFLALRFQCVSVLVGSAFDGVLANPNRAEAERTLRKLLIDRWRIYGPNWGVGFSFVEHDFVEEGR